MAESTQKSDSNSETILEEMPTSQPKNWKLLISIVLFIIVTIALGSFSGFYFWQSQLKGKVKSDQSEQTANQQKPPEPAKDTQTFRDKAEGTIEKNDAAGQYQQGTHKLVRAGGQSQTVYLVSSVVDLNEYLGKKVIVFGETFQSTQVGWLMDVGRVEKNQ